MVEGTPAEYGAALAAAIERGWLAMHERAAPSCGLLRRELNCSREVKEAAN
jgi:hypothetical protein